MRKDELARQKQEKLDKLNELITSTKESAKSVAKDIRDKLELLKVCYERSSSKQKNKVHELTNYSQLRCYLTGEPFSNSYETKPIELEHLVYTPRSIKSHIENGLPKNNNEQAVEIYSFYFGGYRAFFRCFTKEFLELRIKQKKEFIDDVYSQKEEDYNVSEERLEIDGIKIIDEEFIQKVKAGKSFTMPEFYSARQPNFCQWYGIIHEYDVVRNGYDALKNIIIDSFIEEKHEKVTAIVCGSGGSGKSTALRRIAVDLHKEPIHIVWVEDGGIEEFVEKGFPAIKYEVEKNENQKFLIIIEDWYRTFTKENEQWGTDILKKAKSINNIRFVIGDRTIKQSYTDHRSNNFELHLSSDDNKEIIEKIVEKYPDWKLASEKLLRESNTLNNYKSSLFLLLFILARIDQKEFKNETLDLSEPQQVFQRIIESDLRFIKKKYIGLAKAIYYVGCAYSKYKVTFSYDIFIVIANHYNENEPINPIFSNWKIDTPVSNTLKQYFSVEQGIDEGKIYNYIRFNHDVLIDEGLSKLNIQSWNGFDDEVKSELLQMVNQNDNYISASTYISSFFTNEKHLFEDEKQKLYFIECQINKENHHYQYLLLHYKLSKKGKNYLAKTLIKSKIYDYDFWNKFFFSDDPDEWIFDVITIENIKKLNQVAVHEFLFSYIYENTHKRELPIEILKRKIPIKKFVEDILQYDDWLGIDSDVITSSIDISDNVHYKEIFFKKVLTYPNWQNVSENILIKCLQQTKKQELLMQFSNVILEDPDIKKWARNIIGETVKRSSNKELAFYLISNYKDFLYVEKPYFPSVLVKALSIFKDNKELSPEVISVIEYILNIYPESTSIENKTNKDYIECMGLGFHNHTRWKEEAEFNLLYMKEGINNELLLNLLLSYKQHPDAIKNICLEILSSWHTYVNSIQKCIELSLFNFVYSVDHFQIALGHPSLKIQAKATSLEILETLKNTSIASDLKKVVLNIVENDIYPEWEVSNPK
ncbi:MAG: hypothetical protein E2590_04955 [Chryseobacterium sp.]|nr:hypothetical protein [Chryseobacterium sp.]